MGTDAGTTELRRGVLGPCVLALLDERPRFGLELVRELGAAGGLLTSDGTVYPLLTRLRDAGFVTSEWRDPAGERARRYYFITDEGRAQLKAFRADWTDFAATVAAVLFPSPATAADPPGRGNGAGRGSEADRGSGAGRSDTAGSAARQGEEHSYE
jgi:PadR family transcriptional regulator, regulatory protein PadR